MKLRAVRLNNVRQFTQPVSVDGFGPGLNVLNAPNESGKSTLFDAIRAVLFQSHTAKGKWLEAFRPDVGGNPEVTLDFTHEDGADYTLFKRWGGKACAEIHCGARLIARAGEAEAWLTRMAIATQGERAGPAGLLWVRQGLTALDDGDRGERADTHAARRDLLTSVTGEFETLTGGRRMDRALAQAQSELEVLVTSTGRPKAGGPLAEAEARVSELHAREDALAQRADALRKDLTRRRALRRELAELEDPEESQDRSARLARAQADFDAAQRQQEAMDQLTERLERLETTRAELEAQRAQRTKFETRLAQLRDDADKLRPRLDATTAQRDQLATALETTRADRQTAREAQRTAETHSREALRVHQMASQIARRATLATALQEAEALARALGDLKARATTGPSPKDIDALDAAQRAHLTAQSLADATAPQMVLHYAQDDTPRATLDGAEVAHGASVRLGGAAELTMPGYGSLQLRAAHGPSPAADLDRAERALNDALARLGVADIEAARGAARARTEAQRALENAQAQLARLAPDGIDALRAEVNALRDVEAPEVTPDLDAAQSALDAARAALEVIETRETGLQARLEAQTRTGADLTAELRTLEARIEDGTAQLATLPAAAELAERTDQSTRDEAELRAQIAARSGAGPDLATCKAQFDRATAVVEQARADVLRLTADIAALDGAVETRAGEGVEDELADVRARLDRAGATQAALAHEVAVLVRLIDALRHAQEAARDRYFEPVLRELQPLLNTLWPGAELVFNGDDLLPDSLIRDGRREPLTGLSGGTREQIALLVRLAFARLLAKSGRHTPVILDDALVYTDDARMEQMFTALHAQAGDLQIIVLSCRARALRALAGHRVRFSQPPGEAPGA